MEPYETTTWADQEFGDCALGDLRRTRRLVTMAARAAGNPQGTITAVFETSAEREGAFRFLEHEELRTEAIGEATHRATARRCADEPTVWVAVDGSSLNLTDRTHRKGFGAVGTRALGARGLKVMSAMAVSCDGTPHGVCGQVYWARTTRSTCTNPRKDRRPWQEKETRYWIEMMTSVETVFGAQAPGTRPWFQMDRGGDAWPVLRQAIQSSSWVTIRAAYNRRVVTSGGTKDYLWPCVGREPVQTTYDVSIPARHARPARTAHLAVRGCRVTLNTVDLRTKQPMNVAYYAVWVRESTPPPATDKPIEWMLLTTYPVQTVQDLHRVITGYTQRWRVEEFHKAWKSGVCHVEHTQLRSKDAVVRWATVLASVAMRVLRLTYLARTTPYAPATGELSPAEVQAVILLRTPQAPPSAPTLAQIVRWIADVGGYTGPSSGGPPGPLVLMRGLRRIEPLARLLAQRRVHVRKM